MIKTSKKKKKKKFGKKNGKEETNLKRIYFICVNICQTFVASVYSKCVLDTSYTIVCECHTIVVNVLEYTQMLRLLAILDNY